MPQLDVASIIAFIANINIAAYACTKGGVMQMTKAMSNEWADKGINVNAICPGYADVVHLSIFSSPTDIVQIHENSNDRGVHKRQSVFGLHLGTRACKEMGSTRGSSGRSSLSCKSSQRLHDRDKHCD